MKVIDSRVRIRTEELMRAWTTNLNPVFKDYIDWYKMKDRITVMPTGDLIEHAKTAGVEKMVVCGGNHNDNVHIMEQSQKHREIIPVGGINITDGVKKCLEEIKWLKENNSAAVNFGPFMARMDVNDKLFYPIYAYCEYLKIPVIVHASLHYWRKAYMWHGQPQYVDEIAVDFPELKFIMSHGGNGFGPAVLAVAQRHPNIYLEFSALRPKYMAPEFIQAANSYLKRKCIFGTDYPLIEFDHQIDLWKSAIKEDNWNLFFYQNMLDALYNEPIPM